MKNLQGRFRELTYFELLKMNGGHGGSSGGTGGGYSSSSGGSSGSSPPPGNNGKQTFASRDKDTKTTSKKNADGTENITKINTKTGEIISSYTTGLKSGQGSKGYASSSGGSSSYSSTSSGYSAISRGSYSYAGTSRGSHGYSATSSGSSSKTNYEFPSSGSTTNDPKSNFEYQICSNPNEVHCDIIAWNHAVDAGLNPAGKRNKKWDGNKLTVDTIFNTYYADEAVEFNSDLAGKKGYIFYDWKGDGTFDHMEYCEIDNDGGGYSYFSNKGFSKDEKLIPTNFHEDKNAGARHDGNGILKFVSLN